MAIQYGDIVLTNEATFKVKNGDLVGGDNKEHQVGAIINADAGNFRKHPTLSCNLTKKVDGVNDSRDIVSTIKDGIFLDGWELDEIDIQTSQDSLSLTIIEAEKTTDNTSSLI